MWSRSFFRWDFFLINERIVLCEGHVEDGNYRTVALYGDGWHVWETFTSLSIANYNMHLYEGFRPYNNGLLQEGKISGIHINATKFAN